MGKEPHLDLDDFTCRQTIKAGGQKHNRSLSKVELYVAEFGGRKCSGSEGRQSFWDWAQLIVAAVVLAFGAILQLIHKLFSMPGQLGRGTDGSLS
jgi:hypothetical protein